MADDGAIQRMANRESFERRLREGDSYGVLLALIVVSYGLLAVLDDTQWSRTLVGALFGAMFLLALHTSHVRGRWFRLALVFLIVTVAFNAGQAVFGEVTTGTGYAAVVLVVITPMVVLSRILRHPTINLETILGAICAYLLIGIAFADLYGTLDRLSGPFFAQGDTHDPVKYLYFSFIVLTTVGFGDLSPATDTGRILVSFEALLGQIFLVTLVASLVGNMGRRRAARDDVATAPPAAPSEATQAEEPGDDP